MRKFVMKNRTYTVLRELPNAKDLLVDKVYKVMDSKKVEYTLLCSRKSYVLYNEKQQRVASTYSIREIG